MFKIAGTKIDYEKVITNLMICLKTFKYNKLAEKLHVAESTFGSWKNRGAGDWVEPIIAFCKENNISIDEIFSDDIVKFREEKARREGNKELDDENKLLRQLLDNAMGNCSGAFYKVDKHLKRLEPSK